MWTKSLIYSDRRDLHWRVPELCFSLRRDFIEGTVRLDGFRARLLYKPAHAFMRSARSRLTKRLVFIKLRGNCAPWRNRYYFGDN